MTDQRTSKSRYSPDLCRALPGPDDRQGARKDDEEK
jgi:hypothetical protein